MIKLTEEILHEFALLSILMNEEDDDLYCHSLFFML